MKEGTRIIIEGVPYLILSATEGSVGKYMLIIQHDTSSGTDIRISMAALMQRLDKLDSRFELSREIIGWFIDEKLKTGLNTSQIIAIKNKPSAAEGQIRRLMKQGSSVDEIVEVLAFSIADKFWSGILNTSINTIAIPRQDGINLYEKIKSKMIAERHSSVEEFHQVTEDEMEGIIVVE